MDDADDLAVMLPMTSPSTSRARQRLLKLNHQGLLFEPDRRSPRTLRDAPPRPGEITSRWRVGKQLGQGSYGDVFEATHTELPALSAAIKFCTYLGPNHERVRKVFLEESRVMCRLRGANTVRLYDVGETEDGLPYFVMEHLRGRTLESALSEDSLLSAEYVEHLATGLLMGLSEIHDEGFIHQDIKPSNIFICSDYAKTVKILDFGLAHAATEVSNGKVAGTPLYAAPEYLDDPSAMPSKSADIYSAALVLYEVATGFHPFLLRGNERKRRRAREISPPLAHELRRDIPPKLSQVIARGMSIDPRDRPPSARELLASLEGPLHLWTSPAPRDPVISVRKPMTAPVWQKLLWPSAVIVALFLPMHRLFDWEFRQAATDTQPRPRDHETDALMLSQQARGTERSEQPPESASISIKGDNENQASSLSAMDPSETPIYTLEASKDTSQSEDDKALSATPASASSKQERRVGQGSRPHRQHSSLQSANRCFKQCAPPKTEMTIFLFSSVVSDQGKTKVITQEPIRLRLSDDSPAVFRSVQACAFACYTGQKFLCAAPECPEGQVKHTVP